MTKEELDRARAKEAKRILGSDYPELVAQLAACLAREGWTPKPVDPDWENARAFQEMMREFCIEPSELAFTLNAIKRGRELEREEGKR